MRKHIQAEINKDPRYSTANLFDFRIKEKFILTTESGFHWLPRVLAYGTIHIDKVYPDLHKELIENFRFSALTVKTEIQSKFYIDDSRNFEIKLVTDRDLKITTLHIYFKI